MKPKSAVFAIALTLLLGVIGSVKILNDLREKDCHADLAEMARRLDANTTPGRVSGWARDTLRQHSKELSVTSSVELDKSDLPPWLMSFKQLRLVFAVKVSKSKFLEGVSVVCVGTSDACGIWISDREEWKPEGVDGKCVAKWGPGVYLWRELNPKGK